MAEAPHLRQLAYVVLLGTTSAALLDYVFKAQAIEMFGRGDQLLRFFAVYYAATSLLTFLVQVSSARLVLERWGIAISASAPSLALFVGTVVSLLVPGFASLTFARGAESVFRGSLFRTGYELFYTPMHRRRQARRQVDHRRRLRPRRRRASAASWSAWRWCSRRPRQALRASCCSASPDRSRAIVAGSRLKSGYMRTLENSLLDRPTAPAWPTAATARSAIDIATIQRYRAARLQDRDARVAGVGARRRCRPTCATSCGCARATAIACCRCCRGRKG